MSPTLGTPSDKRTATRSATDAGYSQEPLSRESRGHTVLIVGIDGQIGSALATDLRSRGVVVQGTSRKTKCLNETVSFLNLDDQPPELPYAKFSHVVICAGMTNIETCEHNQALCQEINVSGTIALIDRCLESGCFVVYPSSNAVFDGTQAFNKHDDPPNPKSAYGRAKLAIETHLVREPDSVPGRGV